MSNPDIWDALVFKRTTGIIDSVLDINPYNSKGTQSFRTLLSAKIGTQRVMLPLDGHLNPLPHDPPTVLRGFASISKHPDRKHANKSYRLNLSNSQLQSAGPKSVAPPSACMHNDDSTSSSVPKASANHRSS